MALTFSQLTADASTANQDFYDTASISPTANRLLIAFVAVYNTSSTQPTFVDTDGSAYSGTWSLHDSWDFDTGTPNVATIFMFHSASGTSPGSGAVRWNFGEAEGACAWAIIECSDADSSGVDGGNGVVQSAGNNDNTSPESTDTLDPFTSSSNLGLVAYAKNSSTNPMWTASSGWNIVSHVNTGSPSLVLCWAYSDDDTATSAAFTQSTGTAPSGSIIAEIAYAAAGTPTEYGEADVSGTGAVSATGTRTHVLQDEVGVVGGGSISATPNVDVSGAAAITGTGAVLVDIPYTYGEAAILGIGTVGAAGGVRTVEIGGGGQIELETGHRFFSGEVAIRGGSVRIMVWTGVPEGVGIRRTAKMDAATVVRTTMSPPSIDRETEDVAIDRTVRTLTTITR